MNKRILKLCLICLISGILNFLICFCRSRLELPIFLDTVFVMAVLFSYGLLPSIVTLFIFYGITSIIDVYVYGLIPYSLVYSLSGVVIIFITWICIRKTNFQESSLINKILYIVYGIILSALASCVVSGIINYLLTLISDFNESWDGQFLIYSLMFSQRNLLPGLILGRIPMTLIDRFITTFCGWGISICYKLLCEKVQNRIKKK